MSESRKPLGRKEPTDWEHVEKYPLRLASHPEVIGQPLFFGIPWYSAFDDPEPIEIDGRMTFWIGRGNNWGPIRGGHCICAKPVAMVDTMGWYRFYRQPDGSCVGFGLSRGASLYNRKRFDAHWLYEQAQNIDEWTDTPPEEGTSVRAGFDVWRTVGHRRKFGPLSFPPDVKWGISANRWITDPNEVLTILGTAGLYGGCVPLLQSWGDAYPHIVYASIEAIGRLMAEGGECGAVTDL